MPYDFDGIGRLSQYYTALKTLGIPDPGSDIVYHFT
jgi:hypothetical protein